MENYCRKISGKGYKGFRRSKKIELQKKGIGKATIATRFLPAVNVCALVVPQEGESTGKSSRVRERKKLIFGGETSALDSATIEDLFMGRHQGYGGEAFALRTQKKR